MTSGCYSCLLKKKMIVKPCLLVIFSLAVAFLTFPEFAQAIDERSTQVGQVLDYGDFISKVWSWATKTIFALAVLGIAIGGVLFAASNGDEERADIGRQTVRGSVIGMFIVLLSAVFQNFITTPVEEGNVVKNVGDLSTTFTSAAKNLVAIIGAVSAVGIVASGIRLITAAADEIKIEKAKNGIKYSVLGLILTLGAWSILNFVLKVWS